MRVLERPYRPEVITSRPVPNVPAPVAAEPGPGQAERRKPPWPVVLTFLIVATLSLIAFGALNKQASVVVVELMIALASLSVGALLGFLFGIPKGGPGPSTNESSENGDGAAPPRSPALRYQPNNSLEQVSDWLTKILVGVGLVEFGKLSEQLGAVGKTVASSFTTAIPGIAIVSQVTLIAFGVIGFLSSFLWTRVYYGVIQIRADRDITDIVNSLSSEISESKEEAKKAVSLASLVAKGTLSSGSGTEPSPQVAPPPEPPVDADDKVRDVFRRVAAFRNAPAEWESDPAGDLFGSEPSVANGRRLVGKVEITLEEALVLDIRVEGVGDAPQLAGEVLFLLHPTIPDPLRKVPVKDNSAKTTFYSEGWFHVTAIADEGRTVLTLDLRLIPGVPDWFKRQ